VNSQSTHRSPAIAAMRVAGRGAERGYDDPVVTDGVGRGMGVLRVRGLIRPPAGPAALQSRSA
jgi:hypothetical protein